MRMVFKDRLCNERKKGNGAIIMVFVFVGATVIVFGTMTKYVLTQSSAHLVVKKS